MPDDIEQLFSNGIMIREAQWPNRTPGVLFDAPKGIAGQGIGVITAADGSSVSRLVDPNIPAGDWTGATVFILPGSRRESDFLEMGVAGTTAVTQLRPDTRAQLEAELSPLRVSFELLSQIPGTNI